MNLTQTCTSRCGVGVGAGSGKDPGEQREPRSPHPGAEGGAALHHRSAKVCHYMDMDGVRPNAQERLARVCELKEATFAGSMEILNHLRSVEDWTRLFQTLSTDPDFAERCPSPRTLAKIGEGATKLLENALIAEITSVVLDGSLIEENERLLGVNVQVAAEHEVRLSDEQDTLKEAYPVTLLLNKEVVLRAFLKAGGLEASLDGWQRGCMGVVLALQADQEVFQDETGIPINREGAIELVRRRATAEHCDHYWMAACEGEDLGSLSAEQKREILHQQLDSCSHYMGRALMSDPRHHLATRSELKLHDPETIYERAKAEYTLRTIPVERGIALGLAMSADATSFASVPSYVDWLIVRETEFVEQRRASLKEAQCTEDLSDSFTRVRVLMLEASIEKHRYYRLALVKNRDWLITQLE